ncbi:hypothetical protein NXX78_20010 [Bacteroides fragilis]|nr:hypothetical protein [Bacteroides fragilis]
MIPSFQFRGKGSGTARFHLQGRALQVSKGKSSSPCSGIFPENLACGGGPHPGP